MEDRSDQLKRLDEVLSQIMRGWFERARANYVTEEESRQLGIEPEMKLFSDHAMHRIKFSRASELDVTYGLGAFEIDAKLVIESSVNNKSAGFDYSSFVEKLKSHYWRSRHEKPWLRAGFDRFSYSDLMPFEPLWGKSVQLETKKVKADIIRLRFPLNPQYEDLLLTHLDVLRDLVENYCLYPIKRIYAESYHQT